MRTAMRRLAAAIVLCAAAIAPASAQAGDWLYFLNGGNLDLRSADENLVVRSVAITGLVAGDVPTSIDVRPNSGQPYVLTLKTTTSPDQLHLYRVDPITGAATAAGAAIDSPAGDAVTSYGIDFNPVVDRLRVVATPNFNFRMHPDTGALVSLDTPLSFAPGDPLTGTPSVPDVAYDASMPVATTTVYVFNGGAALTLMRLGGAAGGLPSPNGGVLTTIATPDFAGATTPSGFDVSSVSGIAYASVSGIYQIDLATGATRRLRDAGGEPDFAVAPSGRFDVSAAASAPEAGGPVTVTVTRSGSMTGTLTVDYATADGSATAGSDYTPASGLLTFAAGETSKTFEVPVLGDSAEEGTEAFSVQLSRERGSVATSTAAVLGRAVSIVSIADDDAPVPVVVAPPGPGPEPVVIPPRDAVAPVLLLGGVPKTLSRARFVKGFTIKLTPNEAAALEVSLDGSTKRASLAALRIGLFSKRLSLASGTRRVKLKPNPKGVGKLRKAVKVRLTIVATDAAGNRSTTTRTIRVTPDKK